MQRKPFFDNGGFKIQANLSIHFSSNRVASKFTGSITEYTGATALYLLTMKLFPDRFGGDLMELNNKCGNTTEVRMHCNL